LSLMRREVILGRQRHPVRLTADAVSVPLGMEEFTCAAAKLWIGPEDSAEPFEGLHAVI